MTETEVLSEKSIWGKKGEDGGYPLLEIILADRVCGSSPGDLFDTPDDPEELKAACINARAVAAMLFDVHAKLYIKASEDRNEVGRWLSPPTPWTPAEIRKMINGYVERDPWLCPEWHAKDHATHEWLDWSKHLPDLELKKGFGSPE